MSWIKTLFTGGDVVKSIGDTVDNLFTSDEERMEAANERYKVERDFDFKHEELIAKQNMGQMEVNKEDAKGNWFQSGWRPAIGWVGAVSLFTQYILYQFYIWWAAVVHPEIVLPEPLDAAMLMTLITGMLGLGAYRSYDKKEKIDTK